MTGANGTNGNGRAKRRKVCGDWGGMTKEGKPCQRPSPHGLCSNHKPGAFPQSRRKQARLLEAYVKRGSITRACRFTHISPQSHTNWMRDPEYAAAFAHARKQLVGVLEGEAFRRAIEGVEQPVHHLGKRVDMIRKYSDVLLIFLLKAAAPEKYRERAHLQIEGHLTLTDALTAIRRRREAVLRG